MSGRCTPESLRAWGRDYDGSPIAEGGDPMPGFTVGHLYDAAAEIERLLTTNAERLAALTELLAADDAMAAFLLAADADEIGEEEWARQHKARAQRRLAAQLQAHEIIKEHRT